MTDPKYVPVGDPEEGEVCLEELEINDDEVYPKGEWYGD